MSLFFNNGIMQKQTKMDEYSPHDMPFAIASKPLRIVNSKKIFFRKSLLSFLSPAEVFSCQPCLASDISGDIENVDGLDVTERQTVHCRYRKTVDISWGIYH